MRSLKLKYREAKGGRRKEGGEGREGKSFTC